MKLLLVIFKIAIGLAIGILLAQALNSPVLLTLIFVFILIIYFSKELISDFKLSGRLSYLRHGFFYYLEKFKKYLIVLFNKTINKLIYFFKRSSKNAKFLDVFKNKYTKKILIDLTRILNTLKNLTYIKVWKQTFKVNISSTSNEFAKFVWADLLIMFIQGILILGSTSIIGFKIKIVIFIFYFFSAFFPRLFLLYRRLNARNMSLDNAVWMLIPVFGWFVTWKIGGSDEIVNSYEKHSVNEGLNSFFVFLMFVLFLGVMIYIINIQIEADKILKDASESINRLNNKF